MPRIVAATNEHAFAIAKAMREADRKEVYAASGHSPGVAVLLSLRESTLAWAALDDEGEPFAIFGVGPYVEDVGSPWLLATDSLYQHRTFVLRKTRPLIAAMLAEYPILINHVDARHTDSMRWLLFGGFKFDKLVLEYGFEKRPFFRFTQVQNV